MSERKVLNKYYPPDFDPAKIPRGTRQGRRVFSIRTMAPFNMRCNVCGNYIYKGTKFNSRCEPTGDEFLGIKILRFYIRCTRCICEITFRTDPENDDYKMEQGATRNFEAILLAERAESKRVEDEKEEEKNDPMKMLEKRTKMSRQEMDMIDTLDELREINASKARLDPNALLNAHMLTEAQLLQQQEQDDEQFVQSLYGRTESGETVKRLVESSSSDDERQAVKRSRMADQSSQKTNSAERTPLSSVPSAASASTPGTSHNQTTGVRLPAASGSDSKKQLLIGLVRKKADQSAPVIAAKAQAAPSGSGVVTTATSLSLLGGYASASSASSDGDGA